MLPPSVTKGGDIYGFGGIMHEFATGNKHT